MPDPIRLVCTVSGGGRTVLNLLDRIGDGTLRARIPLVVADRECDALPRLRERGVETALVRWTGGTTPESYAERVWPVIEAARPDLVCCCGFLRLLLIPHRWKGRVLNIHPGLLPRFGGKGMYGARVHAAVLASGEKESGCTVHVADNEYDRGPVVVQRKVPVRPDDTPESLAARVFEAECEAYPEAIRLFQEGRVRVSEDGRKVVVIQ